MVQRGQRPVEQHREVERVRRVLVVREGEHGVLEREQRARVDIEGEVQVERAVARVLGVELHLPGLAQGVRLHEMTLFVNVEAVVDGVILQICHEPRHVDNGQPGCLLACRTPPS